MWQKKLKNFRGQKMEEESNYKALIEKYADMVYRIAKGYLRN